jgi:hypothetical protein
MCLNGEYICRFRKVGLCKKNGSVNAEGCRIHLSCCGITTECEDWEVGTVSVHTGGLAEGS